MIDRNGNVLLNVIVSGIIVLALILVLARHAHPDPLCVAHDGLPDQRCTPGSVDPRVTQDNIQQTICNTHYSAKGSWSKTWRPPVSVTNKIKAERARAYGLTLPLDCYEGDHFVLESAGGCPGPTAPTRKPAGVKDDTWKVSGEWCDFVANFWDEPWGHAPNWSAHCGPRQSLNAHDKDKVEDRVHNLVCAGKITLDEAQHALIDGWEAAYVKYVGALPR